MSSVFVLYTAPTAEPVTYLEAKAHLRLEHDADQAYIDRLIKVARKRIEAMCWRGLITQTWELVMDDFPLDSVIELGKGTLQSVTSVTYVDTDGVTQTLASSNYTVDTKNVPGRIMLKPTSSWPSASELINSVNVRFVVGYGDAAAVPEDLKQALLMVVAHLYENREPEVTGTIVARFNMGIEALIAGHRAMAF